jgi:hypothetical protein
MPVPGARMEPPMNSTSLPSHTAVAPQWSRGIGAIFRQLPVAGL